MLITYAGTRQPPTPDSAIWSRVVSASNVALDSAVATISVCAMPQVATAAVSMVCVCPITLLPPPVASRVQDVLSVRARVKFATTASVCAIQLHVPLAAMPPPADALPLALPSTPVAPVVECATFAPLNKSVSATLASVPLLLVPMAAASQKFAKTTSL